MKRLKFWRRKSKTATETGVPVEAGPSEENTDDNPLQKSVYRVVPGSELKSFWDLETDEEQIDFVTQLLMGAFSDDERRRMGGGRSASDGSGRGVSGDEDEDRQKEE